MINAQTITKKYHADARCILGQNPQDDCALSYYFIVDDGADNPILGWGYSAEEAWDATAQKLLGDEVRNHVNAARKAALAEALTIVIEQMHSPDPDDKYETIDKLKALIEAATVPDDAADRRAAQQQ